MFFFYSVLVHHLDMIISDPTWLVFTVYIYIYCFFLRVNDLISEFAQVVSLFFPNHFADSMKVSGIASNMGIFHDISWTMGPRHIGVPKHITSFLCRYGSQERVVTWLLLKSQSMSINKSPDLVCHVRKGYI